MTGPKKFWHGSTTCDFCHKPITSLLYDAPSITGPWAVFCAPCFKKHAAYPDLDIGVHYMHTDNGWEKIVDHQQPPAVTPREKVKKGSRCLTPGQKKVARIFMKRDDISYDEAQEWVETIVSQLEGYFLDGMGTEPDDIFNDFGLELDYVEDLL